MLFHSHKRPSSLHAVSSLITASSRHALRALLVSLEEEDEEEEDEEESLEFEFELLPSIKLSISSLTWHLSLLLFHSHSRSSSHNVSSLKTGSSRHTRRALLVSLEVEDEEEEEEESLEFEFEFELEFEFEFELGPEFSTSCALAKELSVGARHTERHSLAVSSILSLGSMIFWGKENINKAENGIKIDNTISCYLQRPAVSLTPWAEFTPWATSVHPFAIPLTIPLIFGAILAATITFAVPAEKIEVRLWNKCMRSEYMI